MGAGSSKHAVYPFPVPSVPGANGMPPHWPPQKTKKGKEKAHQMYQQYPNGFPPTAYGVQYYPQIQPGYPQVSTYYAPVTMVPIPQPMVGMQQPYAPVQYAPVQYAPVIPSAAPATAPQRMPEPTTNNQAASVPVIPNATPANNQAGPPLVIPDDNGRSGAGVPPPPIITDTPSSRPRFTDFYRPADPPVPMPEPQVTDMPYRPPTVPPVRMTSQSNPLPSPPRDIWETTPYHQLLRDLPKDITLSLNVEQMVEMENLLEQPTGSTSRLGGLFGSSKRNGKPRKGLFRAFSTSGKESDPGRHNHHHRSNTVTSFVIPAAAAIPYGTDTGVYPGVQPMPAPQRGPPIKFNHTGELSGFVNHSPHRVLHGNKMYPTAMHLLEAMKFTKHPDMQERIRTCGDVGDMYPLSASFQQYVRPDWGEVFLSTLEDVLYLKFKQHPNLRALLLDTGLFDLVYADDNTYWGEGPTGTGSNELGKALVRVRERIRADGVR